MTAADRIEALHARNPGAVELALAVSLAVRVEPDLLRHARLMVAADAAAEADLWWSDLVASQNSDGIMLDPDVAEELRARLAAPQRRELREAAWALVGSQHAGEHVAVRLEELVNWLSIAGEPDTADRIEELLVAGAHEWMASAEVPAGGVRWILSALRRLPRLAAESPAGTLIGLAAASHVAGPGPPLPAAAELPSDALDNWFPWLLARLPPASIAVALVDRGIEFEGARESSRTIVVPETDPVTLELAWHDGAPRRRRVEIRRGVRATIALDADEVELTTLAGRRFTLRRTGRAAAAGGLDFAAVRAAHRPAAGLEPIVEEIVGGVRSRGGWGAIQGRPGTGKTTALCAALDALEAGGDVVLQHFYGRGPAWWDDDETVMASLVAQLRAAVPGLPAPENAVLASAPRSNVRAPGAALEVLLTASGERDGPRVVVALDDPPADDAEALRRWLPSAGLPSLVPPRSAFVAAGRYAGAIRDFLEDGDPYWSVDLTHGAADAVCQAYVRALWDPLLAALGLPARPIVALSGFIPASLAEKLRERGFAPIFVPDDVEQAVERCDAGVILLGDEPVSAHDEFGRLCRERGLPVVVVVVGENADWERTQAVAGGRLDVADRILARDLGVLILRSDHEAQDAAEARVADELRRRLSALVWPFADVLIALAGTTIERLRPLVDWLAARPPGSASLDTLPASLIGAMPWSELQAPELRHVTCLAAVAQPDFALRDALWATPAEEWPSLLAAIGRLRELHLLDDPSGRLASLPSEPLDPDALVETLGGTPLRSADPDLAERVLAALGDRALAAAHRWLADAQRVTPASAAEYFARHAMAHAVACGDADVVRRLCDESALTRQARRLGLHAVAADLALARTLVDDRFLAAVHEAVLALAARGAPVADFAPLLYHELAVRVGPEEASHHLHPNGALRPYLEGWPEPDGEARETRFVAIAALVGLGGGAGAAAATHEGELRNLDGTPWGVRSYVEPGAALVGLPGPRIAAVHERGVTVLSPDGTVVELPAPPGRHVPVWTGRAGASLLAASADGALLHWPESASSPRVLLAHTAVVTSAVGGSPSIWQEIARAAVVEVVADDHSAGHAVFVADGVALADSAAAAAVGDATELGVTIDGRLHRAWVEHRDERSGLTLLRADVDGHAIVPLAAPAPLDAAGVRELRLDRHEVVGPTLVRDRTVVILRRRDTGVLGAGTARRAFERSGLGGFVFDRGCLFAVIGAQQEGSMIAAEPVAELEPVLAGDRSALRALASAGAWFATGAEDGTVAVWSSDADAPVHLYRGHGAAVRTLTATGRFLASGGDDGTLRLWTPDGGRDVAVLGTGSAAITASADARDGRIAWGAADGAVGVWDPRSPARSRRLAGHGGGVIGLEVDEDTLTSWAADGSVAIRSLSASRSAPELRGPAPARHAVRVGGTEVAVLWGDDSVTVERAEDGDAARSAECLAVSPDGEQIARGLGEQLAVSGRPRRSKRGGSPSPSQGGTPLYCTFAQTSPGGFEPRVLTSADLEPEGLRSWEAPATSIATAGRWVAVGLADGAITLRNPANIRRPTRRQLSAPGAAAVLSLAGAEAGPVLLSGHTDGTIRAWRLDLKRPLQRTFVQGGPPRHVALAAGLALSADGELIRLWDLGSGEQAGVLGSHGGEVTGLAAIAPTNAANASHWLASCSQDGTLCLWDLPSRHCLETFRAPVPLVALAAGGRTVAARDAEGRTYAWTVRRIAPATTPEEKETVYVARRLDVPGQLRWTVSFGVDVELLSVDLDEPIARVAVDQREGFWDALDERGAFVVPPLVAAGRAVDVRIEQESRPLDPELRFTLRSARDGRPHTVRGRPGRAP